MFMEQWRGRNAVVTGAGSGIGAATTVELLKNGVNVIGLDVRPERLEVCIMSAPHSHLVSPRLVCAPPRVRYFGHESKDTRRTARNN